MTKHNYQQLQKFIFFLLICPALLFAQNNGTISGKITDTKGEPVPYANVILVGTTMGAATDIDGNYILEKIPVGNYTLRITVIGYREANAKTNVTAGQITTQNFVLAEDVLQMEGVVITGTAGGSGVRKKDASFAITTLPPAEISQFSPPSTAAVLDLVPGVWSESSGGVAGANIMVRGLPSGGDAPFVTMSINGAPIYGTQSLSFFEQSSIFRIDETIMSTEALRGGPSSVFSNGETGLTTNFNLIKGSSETKGRVKYTTSDYSEQRVDAVLSGPISEKFYYMVGGYTKTSPGIRNTQFNAENGQQITLQLTKVFEKGVFNTFARFTDDRGQWVLPMALGTGNDYGTFTPLGNATRYRTLAINTQGDRAAFDFSKGRGWKGVVAGLNFDYDLGNGWTVRDNLSYTSGNAPTYGFVPNGNPMKVFDLLKKLKLNSISTVGGKTLTSGYVQSYGFWVVEKDLGAVTNDISLTKKVSDHSLTFGAYQSYWTSKDFWTLGNHVVVENVTNGDIIAGVSSNDVGGSWNYGLNSYGDARTIAFYFGDSWQINEKFRLDFGARYNSFNLNYSLDAGSLPDGTIDLTAGLTGEDWAGTIGLNYSLNEEMGVFLRSSKGSLFPQFDQIREGGYSLKSGTTKDGVTEPNIFNQSEAGLKYDSGNISSFLTLFYNQAQIFDGGVGTTREGALLKTRTFGAELDGAVSIDDFLLRVILTYQNGKITDTKKGQEIYVGNKIWRQPDLQFRLVPSYNIKISESSSVNIFLAYRYVGNRWNDRDNSYELDPYSKIDAGIELKTGGGLSFNLIGDNLSDSKGLTEGDPRDPNAKNGRPIFGRSVKFSVVVNF
ncbi:MAG: TonB-dependent receptor [Bacteroidota bacterium]